MLHAQLTGSVLHGTYRLLRLVGEGGMGTVYEAIHQRLDRRFAVKILHHKAAADAVAVTRFKREAQITSNLGSKHIVDVVDFNVTQNGVQYLVMELLEGEDLEARLGRCGKLTLPQAVVITEQVVAALYAAHRSGIVHRDLKPSNIFLCRQDEGEVVKVLDFGISKIIGDRDASITGENALIGTPHYMAPEQIQNGEVDYRTDVWATGAIVYEMLAGMPPFHSPRIPAVFFKIVQESPVPLGVHTRGLPAGLEQVVLRALSKSPDDRQPSIRAFWRELADVVGVPYRDLSASSPDSAPEFSGPVAASPAGVTLPWAPTQPAAMKTTLSTGTGETWPTTPRSRRAGLALGGVLVAMAVAVVLLLTWGRDRTRGATAPASNGSPRVASADLASSADLAGATAGPTDVGMTAVTAVAASSAPAAATAAHDAAPRPSQRTGRVLWLRTRPARARVRVEGGPVLGSTPLRGADIGLEPIVVVVAAPGHRTRRLQVGGGHEPVHLGTVVLERLTPAMLQLAVLARGASVPARVLLDGKNVGQAPLILRHLEPGRHLIETRWQGSPAVRKRIVLHPGQTLRLSLRVDP